MSFFVEPPVLIGNFVTIEPLALRHAQALFEIGSDPGIWRWLPESHFTTEQDAENYIGRALELRETGEEFPFAVTDLASGRLAGTTRYLEISETNRGIEIGWTWYGVDFQRTPVNTETKLLLMEYAFEKMNAIRLQLKTDSRNLRSQTAIQRIGATLEGTLRNHRILPKDGYIRDTVYFSVIDSEWPAVKAHLQEMLMPRMFDETDQ
jgi:RimJ/RimL family protein N-acetyltransferase